MRSTGASVDRPTINAKASHFMARLKIGNSVTKGGFITLK
jgi:hypothetical protein